MYLWLIRAALEICHYCSLHLVGLLGVALHLSSCVLLILFTFGAKALPQTHSIKRRQYNRMEIVADITDCIVDFHTVEQGDKHELAS